MVYKNKTEVILDGWLYPVDTKWTEEGEPFTPPCCKAQWFDDDIPVLDDISIEERLKLFKAYPHEKLPTWELLQKFEDKSAKLKKAYQENLLKRQKFRLRNLTKGTIVKTVGTTNKYFFDSLVKYKDNMSVKAKCYFIRKNGEPSKQSRLIPIQGLEVPDNEELTKLLQEDYN